jgi:hypothetical protein
MPVQADRLSWFGILQPNRKETIMKPLPIRKLKDGLITAMIWKNEIETGKFRYSVTFARAYLKDDQWHEAYSFSAQSS